MDEFLEEEERMKQEEREGWNLNKDKEGPHLTLQEMIKDNKEEEKIYDPVAEAEEDEEIAELIERQFARPEKDNMDCESICSTYSNLLNHPRLIGF